MAIADQLTQLNQVKSDIKQALIGKDIDMTDVPFTGYAEKIAGIKTGVERTYLFKAGVLAPGYSLPSGLYILNNRIVAKNAGATLWEIDKPIGSGKTVMIKASSPSISGSGGNEAYLQLQLNGKLSKLEFNSDQRYNGSSIVGLYEANEVKTFGIAFYTYANSMGIEEMWIE